MTCSMCLASPMGSRASASPLLFEIGEELSVRIEQDGTVTETTVRVRSHIGPADARITELELLDDGGRK